MHKKGIYGRFAEKWFSKKGWSSESRRAQGLSQEDLTSKSTLKNVESTIREAEMDSAGDLTSNTLVDADANVKESLSPEEIPKALGGQHDTTTATLLPKILRTTKMYFASGNFFFSYDYDLSHSISNHNPNSTLALFKQFDPLVS